MHPKFRIKYEEIELNVELLKILEEEGLYWFRKSHETWLLKEDLNIGFFHRVANGRKRKHTVFFH
jgi:hypothetical protein